MTAARTRSGGPGRRSAMSLVEAMVALALTSALLVATGAAFTASASLAQNNAYFFQAEQAAA